MTKEELYDLRNSVLECVIKEMTSMRDTITTEGWLIYAIDSCMYKMNTKISTSFLHYEREME